jgi:hypothetical protein
MIQAVPSRPSPRVSLVTGSMNLGGSTMYLCNFAGELIRRNLPAQMISFQTENPLPRIARADMRWVNVRSVWGKVFPAICIGRG